MLILTNEQKAYRALIESAGLPALQIVETPSPACEIVFGEPALIRKMLPELPNLKWAQSIWAGIEPLLDPSLRRDYILTNARGVFGRLMAEYVFAYLLENERKIVHLRALQKKKIWDDSNVGTLRNKIIAILGIGSIGAEVARTAKFFGMQVRGYTRGSRISEHVDEYFHGDDLPACVSGADYLVNILPNTKETKKLIGAEVFKALPAHAVFINVGRGSAVDESALLAALKQDKIAGAVLDVFEQEPLPKEHPFWEAPNLTMTFHTAAPSLPADIVNLFIENYRLYMEGKSLKYIVDLEKGY